MQPDESHRKSRYAWFGALRYDARREGGYWLSVPPPHKLMTTTTGPSSGLGR